MKKFHILHLMSPCDLDMKYVKYALEMKSIWKFNGFLLASLTFHFKDEEINSYTQSKIGNFLKEKVVQ